MILQVAFEEISADFEMDISCRDQTLPLEFEETSAEFDMDFGEIQEVTSGEIDVYMGAHTVTPSDNQTVLGTENKLVRENITVHAIPFFSVGNTSGGNTVYIGSEKEIELS